MPTIAPTVPTRRAHRRVGGLIEDVKVPGGAAVVAHRPRRALSVALFSVALGTNVSTPLLLIYQDRLDLSAWTVTALFAVYPIGLVPTLMWAGPASDVLGRRKVMVPGIAASGVASALFLAGSESLAVLFVARLMLGAVSGVVFVVASAWMQEVEPTEDPLWPSRLTSMILYSGFGGGPVIAGILGQWAPWPLHLSYLVHIAVVVIGLLVALRVPETVHVEHRPFRPSLGVPAATRRVFLTVVVPTALCVFGFASMSLGLFPVLLRPVMASVAVFVTGVVAGITAVAIFSAQRMVARLGAVRAAPWAFACGAAGCLLGVIAFATDMWALTFPGAALLGAASGLALVSGLRFVDVLTTPSARGAMTGSFYAAAYAAMTMPVIVSSLARTRTAYVIVLSVVTALAVLGGVWVRRTVHLVPALTASAAAPAPSGSPRADGVPEPDVPPPL
jgi:MFS family permease